MLAALAAGRGRADTCTAQCPDCLGLETQRPNPGTRGCVGTGGNGVNVCGDFAARRVCVCVDGLCAGNLEDDGLPRPGCDAKKLASRCN